MRRRWSRNRMAMPPAYENVIALWCLRLLIRGNALRQQSRRRGAIDDELLEVCGISVPEDDGFGCDRPSIVDIRRRLRDRLAELEHEEPALENPLAGNLECLAQRVGLRAEERDVLAFLVLQECSHEFDIVVSNAVVELKGQVDILFAIALGRPVEEISPAVAMDGLLCRSGLIGTDRSPFAANEHGLQAMPALARQLLQGRPGSDLFKPFFRAAPQPVITVADIPHLDAHFRRLLALLRSARRAHMPGVNILLYGQPGTGKTEFSRLLCAELGYDLQEVGIRDTEGRPLEPSERMGSWHLVQHLLGRDEEALVLFDELEDAFPSDSDRGHDFRRRQRGGKAWVNHALERNPVPTIWIANDEHVLDTAYLRRFMVALELKSPPQEVRRAMVRRHCGDLDVSVAWQERVAAHAPVTPAQVSRVAELARLTKDELAPKEREAFMDDQLTRQLELQGAPPLPEAVNGAEKGMPWRIDLIEASAPLDPLLEGLRSSGSGSLLLYGPPGTGKTALATNFARRLGRPLVRKYASDLMNCYLGMTEKNIRDMFREAAEQGAVLLLDEADSMLRSREGARASWEVTQVNEMLARMERFDGIFVCATNFLELTDSAALRRFDVKLRLDYPGAEARWALFRHLLRHMSVPLPRGVHASAARGRLSRLANLAPGDFATIARRYRRLGERFDVQRVLTALEEESQIKPDAPVARIGF